MNKEKFILSNEEATIIRKFRGEQEAIDRKVRYFNFLSSQHDFQNDLEFISIRTSLYKFLKNIFSIYYRWCKEHDVCFFLFAKYDHEKYTYRLYNRKRIRKL